MQIARIFARRPRTSFVSLRAVDFNEPPVLLTFVAKIIRGKTPQLSPVNDDVMPRIFIYDATRQIQEIFARSYHKNYFLFHILLFKRSSTTKKSNASRLPAKKILIYTYLITRKCMNLNKNTCPVLFFDVSFDDSVQEVANTPLA